MTNKQEILATLREEYNRWEELLARLSEAQIVEPRLPENWSIKDVIAHLHAWQQRTVARLEAAQLGTVEPAYPAWPDQLDPEEEGQPHDLNAWLYAQTRDQSWLDVQGNWRTTFQRVLDLAEAIPEDDLLPAGKYSWMEDYPLIEVLQGTFEHHQEHAEYLAPVLADMEQRAR